MSTPTDRTERLRERLQAELKPSVLEITDDSHLHAGHAGAASGGSHYSVKIVSDQFEGRTLVMRHRLVYDAVHEMINKAEIHALAITATAPSEQS
ncbi:MULTISPECIES: BolA family transcriptional regulator [unclassified Massilia]|uniref:BolA family protein n=1 Tax=unclassified Massilia TaxID=2609279 RepID=UPI001B835178|nr:MULTISPECIES: BolA family protein [unclassified Massilia]MBQ5938538.1 BolA family transcriptional regulator [Massilia sp. AB1]MBQ5965257.1 BolA family transcriptional regulator [Massilia sp. ZL223]